METNTTHGFPQPTFRGVSSLYKTNRFPYIKMVFVTFTIKKSNQTFILPSSLNFTQVCLVACYSYSPAKIGILVSDITQLETVNNTQLSVIGILPLAPTQNCYRDINRDSFDSITLRLIDFEGDEIPITKAFTITLNFK